MDLSFYRGRRVLLTGHTGFKGAWLASWLESLGAEVCGYALPPATQPNLFETIALDRRIRSELGDIRDGAALRAAFREHRPELVFHLAAQALVSVSYQQPLETFSTNVAGTASVLDACLESDSVRAVVVVSSDKCYENQGWDRGYREEDPVGGYDPYSASKGCTELVASSYRRSFFAAAKRGLATARAGNVIGGGDWTAGRLVPDCLLALSRGEPVALRHPESVRPWQHVLEPLSGYLSLGLRLDRDPAAYAQAWNFGPAPEDARPVREVVDLCYRAWGAQPFWRLEPGRHPHEASILRLDCSKAQSKLDWRPRWRLPEALTHTVDWHKAFLARGDVVGLMRQQMQRHVDAHA
jgi:CDP-glucose 4,6-dehydratase